MPALNEEDSIGAVIEEIRAFDPGFEVVVIDDGSTDRTAEVAAEHGAQVLRLPFNLGIGGAVQTGLPLRVRAAAASSSSASTATASTTPRELGAVLAPVLAGEADVVVGSRFVGTDGYRSSARAPGRDPRARVDVSR